MKKVFILASVFFCVAGISFSSYCQETQKVLVAAELVGFEIDEEVNVENGEIINTSLKTLGVVTYIKPENNQFVALGHSLIDSKVGTNIEAVCYDVKFREKGNGNFSRAYLNDPIGYVYYDNYCGIWGELNNVEVSKYQEVETANRYEIKKGNANILIRLDGENLESYEVEILAVNYIDNNKNIRIKITDEKLIGKTGGIIRGMSGTPVMQNGKLVGAINCVNAKDSKDAYAIFIDKIL